MARHVSSLVQALDAAIAGEPGHIAVNRMIFLHENKKTVEEVEEYWKLRGRAAKAINHIDPRAKGYALSSRMMTLYDNLDQTRGITHPEVREVIEAERAEFWVLRSRIARNIEGEA